MRAGAELGTRGGSSWNRRRRNACELASNSNRKHLWDGSIIVGSSRFRTIPLNVGLRSHRTTRNTVNNNTATVEMHLLLFLRCRRNMFALRVLR